MTTVFNFYRLQLIYISTFDFTLSFYQEMLYFFRASSIYFMTLKLCIFKYLNPFPYDDYRESCARLNLGDRNSMLVSLMDGRDPATNPSHVPPMLHLSQKLEETRPGTQTKALDYGMPVS